MKMLRVVSSLTLLGLALLGLAGCADPMGPPLGLGPGLDEIASIAILAILFAVLYRPLRNRLGSRSEVHHTLSPKDIARERYVRGEVTQDEFQRMMQQLSESQGDSA